MRGTSIIAAVATALLIPLSSAKCARDEPGIDDSEANAATAGCGNLDEVAKCFAGGMRSTQLYDCLVSSGCDEKQAMVVQSWHDGDCVDIQAANKQASGGDLRRRQAIRRVAATATIVDIAPRITSMPQQVTARQDDEIQTPLVCLTTTMVSTSFCITTTDAGNVGTVCQPTTSPSVSCNEGLFCSTNPTGDTLCMKIRNTPDLTGIIASGFLSFCFLAMFGSVLFMSCRSRSRTRRAEKQKEAMLIASGAKSGLGATSSEVHLPLMHPQATQGHHRDISADYSAPRPYGDRGPNSRRASPGGSPFRDGSSLRTSSLPAPPGSGDVGLNTEAMNPLNMEDNDIGYGRHS